MQYAEEPFVTRQAVVATLRLGEPSTEAPFKTLRANRAASPGWWAPIRSHEGRLAGRLHLYSALNKDAARLYRLGHYDASRRLAAAALDLETSPSARVIKDAIAAAAASAAAWAEQPDRSDHRALAWHRFLRVQRRENWIGLDRGALLRDWLASSRAWFDEPDDERLRTALIEITHQAADARADEESLQQFTLTAFVGVVERLDPHAAELRGEGGERWFVLRRDLDREGLGTLGQAVSVVREELPHGQVVLFVAPAILLERSAPSEFDLDPFGGPVVHLLARSDSAWLERVVASEPRVLPAVPVLLREES